ncbi:MAG: hypothetical protein KAS32_08435 [Candidatus Peribacteraceae bacterium]|nr:hypothetical protein [Candidatus Peribacteraceae bacterium]
MAEDNRNIRPNYTIGITMGDLDFSNNLETINILSSILAPYQTVQVTFRADAGSILLEDILGGKDIELNIEFMGDDETPKESILLKLITIGIQIPVDMTENDGSDQAGRQLFSMVCFIKEPFEFMTTTVNKLFDDSKSLQPIQMVEELISLFTPSMNTEIKTEGQNEEIITQFVVPPMKMVDAIRYMDATDKETIRRFGSGIGLYKGPTFFQCKFEDNTFVMWNLAKEMESAPAYTIYHLAKGADDTELMRNSGVDGSAYYIRGTIDASFRGNLDIIQNSYITKFLSKPIDTFTEWKELNMDTVFEESAVHDGGQLLVNESVKKRLEYRTIGEIGYETSEAMYYSRLAKRISSMSSISFTIDRNLFLTPLARVGVSIELKPQAAEYADLQGKYIVNSTNITLNRQSSDVWIGAVKINAFRGNLKKL